MPGEDIFTDTGTRAGLLMARILALPEDEVVRVLGETVASFSGRHRRFEELLERHFALVAHRVADVDVSRERRLLIGAYFTNEYSVEGAALFNPSLVPAPDQAGLRSGETRFVMSLRAVGEGHISSIEFRTGVVDGSSTVTFDPLGPCLVTGDRVTAGRLRQGLVSREARRARRGQRRRLGDHRSAPGAVHARRPRSAD